MAINKKLIHFKEKADFVNEVANNNILDHSIVFIQDSKEISTHGTVYKTVNWSVLKKPDYMRVVALEDGLTVSFTNPLEYSFDSKTWKSLPANTQTPAINKDQYVAFRANLTPGVESGIGIFSIDKQCDLKGNCMSLLFGDEFSDKKDLTGYYSAFLNLFYNQSNIKSVDPGFLPATTLSIACYFNMFARCTGLTTAPELPATTLTDYCYDNMFRDCTNLITAPELPATTLATYCYECMFKGCTSLTTAPELPATTLATRCYEGMFEGCTKLNYIKALFITTPSSSYTYNWVSGVSSTGTFVKSNDATWDVIGVNGIPENWDVLNAKPDYMKVVALEDDLTVSFTNPLEYSFDEITWQSLPTGTKTPAINKDQYVAFRANLTPEVESGIGTFSIDKQCDLKGNCMSLLFGDDFSDKVDLTGYDYAFYTLFYNQPNIKSVDPGFLPATTLANNCYMGMFVDCINLTAAPELPATILAISCYGQMFYDCTSLTTAPELPATTLYSGCYAGMFQGCTNLTKAPELPATTLTSYCYNGMFYDCTSLTTAPELPATTLADRCYNMMFMNCTGLTTAPELPATTLINGCYSQMFFNCNNLNYIKALFTTTPNSSYTNNWVSGVSSTGTFVKSKDATWNVTGNSGVPTNWTVEVA